MLNNMRGALKYRFSYKKQITSLVPKLIAHFNYMYSIKLQYVLQRMRLKTLAKYALAQVS